MTMTMTNPTPNPDVLSDARAREVWDRVGGAALLNGELPSMGIVYRAMIQFAKEATPPASEATAIPAGWKLVPVEATEDMLSCMLQGEPSPWNKGTRGEFYGTHENMASNYAAMLAASPTPPALSEQPAPSEVFVREERYIVFKKSHLTGAQIRKLERLTTPPSIPPSNCHDDQTMPTVKCVVVEANWPEYEPVWQMIQSRMEAARG